MVVITVTVLHYELCWTLFQHVIPQLCFLKRIYRENKKAENFLLSLLIGDLIYVLSTSSLLLRLCLHISLSLPPLFFQYLIHC